MNILLILGAAGFGLYYLNQKGLLPGGGAIALPGLPTFKPGGTDSDVTRTSVAARAGQELSELTGNPKFSEAGVTMGRMFQSFSINDQKRDLVQNYQNPLGQWLGVVIAAFNQAVAAGRATPTLREQVKVLLRAGANEFYTVCRMPRFLYSSGPGGIKTIQHVVEDILIADMDRVSL